MSQFLSILAAVVTPVVGAIIGVFRNSHRSRIGRRMRYHQELADAVQGNADAKTQLDLLIAREAEEIRRREVIRLNRTLKTANLVFTIVFAVILGVGLYLLAEWVIASQGWIRVLAGTCLALGAVVSILFIAAALTTIYEHKDPNPMIGPGAKL